MGGEHTGMRRKARVPGEEVDEPRGSAGWIGFDGDGILRVHLRDQVLAAGLAGFFHAALGKPASEPARVGREEVIELRQPSVRQFRAACRFLDGLAGLRLPT